MQASPYTLYVFHISYFSGKIQAYLRYKGIEHDTIEPRGGFNSWNFHRASVR